MAVTLDPVAGKSQSRLLLEPAREPDFPSPGEESRAARRRFIGRLRLLWDERQFLLRLACAGLAASTLVAFLIPKRYVATTQLMPPDSHESTGLALLAGIAGGQGGGQMGGLGAVAGDLLGLKTTGALFVGVLRSRTVEDRIVDRFHLKEVYGERLAVAARDKLADHTSISEDRKSGIITLGVSDRDPRRAAAIAGAYVEELDALMAQLTTSSARRERLFLEDRLQRVKLDLAAAEKYFSEFSSQHATVDIKEQGKAMVEAAASLEGQLLAAEAQLQGLKQIYTDDNVRVRSTQARIDELRREVHELAGKPGTAETTENALGDGDYPSLRQLPILGVPYADLYRQLRVEEVVYESLTKEYELAKVQEAKEIPTVKVLDPPAVPERKSYPPRLLFISLGTVGTVTLGVLWVAGRASWMGMDDDDPGKLLAKEVWISVKAQVVRAIPPKHAAEGETESREGSSPTGARPAN